MALTPKQARFAAEYLIDLNATQAAIRAGYSPKTAKSVGHENLTKPDIAQAVQAGMQARSQRTEITQDRVLQELARIAFFDLRKLYDANGNLKDVHALDDDAAAVLAGLEVTEELGSQPANVQMEDQPHGGRLKRTQGGREVVGFTKKVKIPDKVAALGLAMRHLGMLKDKTEIDLKFSLGEELAKLNGTIANAGSGSSVA